MYFVYMIKNGYNDLYVGISKNPQQRLAEHNQKRGSLYTKRESKFELVFLEEHIDLTAAREREVQIKKWRRDKKEALIERYRLGLPTKLGPISFKF
ncbi:MAG: GIY-YIG nuclease family protein [Minisyncoccia bacterium]